MEDLCQRIPRVSAKIFGLVENQTLIKCKESSRVIYNFMENERFFWIRIILGNQGSLQDSWKKVVDKTPFSIIKEFAISIQQFLNMVCYENDGQQIWSPLYIAAGVGNSELYKYIATKTSYGNHENDDKKWTDLQYFTVYHSNFETFSLIFENVANKNFRIAWANIPLHIAVDKGCFEVYNLNFANEDNRNPNYHKDISLAALGGHLKLYKLILGNTKVKTPEDVDGCAPLHYAAMSGHFYVCKSILEHIGGKNPINNLGTTPRIAAFSKDYLKIAYLRGHLYIM